MENQATKTKKTDEAGLPPRYMIKEAFRAAFPYTIPIFAGFWFLGLTYGIYMNVTGFHFWYPMLMSLTIFAGSVEFVAVNLLLGAFNPIQALAMTLMINARHLFYGISMLDKFRGMGLKRFYLIFGMCDESFSINYTAKIPEGVDRGWFMFFVTFLNHMYWFTGASLGGVFGSLIQFNTEGLDFVMTAMFVVIFMEQWLKERNHTSSLLGLGISLLCLLAFGAENFIIPAMIAIFCILTFLRKPLEQPRLMSALAMKNPNGPDVSESFLSKGSVDSRSAMKNSGEAGISTDSLSGDSADVAGSISGKAEDRK